MRMTLSASRAISRKHAGDVPFITVRKSYLQPRRGVRLWPCISVWTSFSWYHSLGTYFLFIVTIKGRLGTYEVKHTGYWSRRNRRRLRGRLLLAFTMIVIEVMTKAYWWVGLKKILTLSYKTGRTKANVAKMRKIYRLPFHNAHVRRITVAEVRSYILCPCFDSFACLLWTGASSTKPAHPTNCNPNLQNCPYVSRKGAMKHSSFLHPQ